MLTRRQFAQSGALVVVAGPGLAFAYGSQRFAHGVASGDPQADRVVLWSRVGGYDGTPEVRYEVALAPDFSQVVRHGTVSTHAGRDFTLKVDVGGLAPGRVYYYRFSVDGEFSTIGRTKTLPADDAVAARFAVVSCSNYPAGFFNVYRAIGQLNALDAVIHLGDYLYEYPADGYAGERAAEFGRLSEPAGELLTLADYRRRYAQYRSDPDLQYVHARQPFIVSWDDHEFANDAWTGGAQNHGVDEGSWQARRDQALRAYYEWMPIREPNDRPLERAYRSFRFGKLATLAMIESRISARARPLNFSEDVPNRRAWFDISDPRKPKHLSAPEGRESATAVSTPLAYDMRSEPAEPVLDYRKLSRWNNEQSLPEGFAYLPDTDRFKNEVLQQPGRDLLGAQQFDWLEQTFARSQADGVAWNLLGNQTLVSHRLAPNLHAELSSAEKAALPPWIQEKIPLTRFRMPWNLDGWDGYPNARERLLRLTAATGDALVLAGDTHHAWAAPLQSPTGHKAGFELGAPSVSSPGIPETLGLPADRIRRLFHDANPHFEYLETENRGFVLVQVTADDTSSAFRFVNRIDQRRFFTRTDREIKMPRRNRR